MINGATQILAGVPGRHLDPFMLIQSQTTDTSGYVVVALSQLPIATVASHRQFFDLLFFRGSEILFSARLAEDVRFHLPERTIFESFKNTAANDSKQISLFVAHDVLLSRFISTFFYEPCLKILLESLSKVQLSKLIKNAGCPRGIIEIDDLAGSIPTIHLSEFDRNEPLIKLESPSRRGKLLLYDTQRNNDLLRVRFPSSLLHLIGSPGDFGPDDSSNLIRPAQPRMDIVAIPGAGTMNEPDPILDEKEAQEFTDLINKILNSSDSPALAPAKSTPPQDDAILITRKQQEPKPDENKDEEEGKGSNIKERAKPSSSQQKSSSRRRSTNKRDRADVKSDPPHLEPIADSDKPKITPQSPPEELPESVPTAVMTEIATPVLTQDYVKLFERLFRSFRQVIFECYGDKSEQAITDAERKVRFLTPEFDLRSLNKETAVVVLDVVEAIANDAPFFKKPKLRDAALTLVADIYNKQYELLDKLRAIERVEQFYYRLKR